MIIKKKTTDMCLTGTVGSTPFAFFLNDCDFHFRQSMPIFASIEAIWTSVISI